MALTTVLPQRSGPAAHVLAPAPTPRTSYTPHSDPARTHPRTSTHGRCICPLSLYQKRPAEGRAVYSRTPCCIACACCDHHPTLRIIIRALYATLYAPLTPQSAPLPHPYALYMNPTRNRMSTTPCLPRPAPLRGPYLLALLLTYVMLLLDLGYPSPLNQSRPRTFPGCIHVRSRPIPLARSTAFPTSFFLPLLSMSTSTSTPTSTSTSAAFNSTSRSAPL